MVLTVTDFLKTKTYKLPQIRKFLDPAQLNWAMFDPQLGYRLRPNNIIHDGVDGCRTLVNMEPTGERRRVNYPHKLCRINTYGNSFTQGVQTSDGETWQEYLSAHFGEPIRNLGVGGYGVYQAYLRILREEVHDLSAEYVILNIWGIDDHLRSLDAWRYLRVQKFFQNPRNVNMFHANPWAHIRIDPVSGEFLEIDNPFDTPESLYKLCDEEFVYKTFKDDIIVQLYMAMQEGSDADFLEFQRLAEILQIDTDFSTAKNCKESAIKLYIEYGLRASMYIVKKTWNFLKKLEKKLLVLLSYSSSIVVSGCEGKPRIDQCFVQFLEDNQFPYVDTLDKHIEDYKSFSLPPEEYVNRYYITPYWGHYNPAGNHFFAFAIKDSVLDWLDPKPITYQEKSETI